MKETEKLYDAITNLPDERIEAAQRHRFARRWSARLRRMAPIAAALVLAVGVGWFLSSGGLQMAGSGTTAAPQEADRRAQLVTVLREQWESPPSPTTPDPSCP